MTLQNLIDNPLLPRVILVELHPYDLNATAEVIIGFSDGSDAPYYNNFLWHERISTSLSTNVTITKGGFDLGGFVTPTYGVVTLKTGDGFTFTDSSGTARDLRKLSWNGRQVRVLVGSPTDSFGSFEVVFDGIAEDFTWDENNFVLSIRDKAGNFDDELQTNTFAGTGGLEGGTDVKGEIKPLCYGEVKNVAPVLVDSFYQIYVMHDGSIQAVDGVFDNAVQLTNAGDISTLSLPALTNWTPEGGKFITDLANGAIRLGAEPAGVLTVDLKGDDSGSGYVTKIADIIQRILTTKGGLTTGDLDTTYFTQFNTDFPGNAGIYIDSDVSIRRVLDTLLLNVNAYGIATPQGKIRIGRIDFDIPALTVDANTITVDSTTYTVDQTVDSAQLSNVIEDADIVSIQRQETANPVWKTKVGYAQVYRVQEIEDVEIPDNVASDPFNLLHEQGLLTEETGDFTWADKLQLDLGFLQPIAVGDVLSLGIEIKDPTANVTNVRVQALFYNSSDAQVGTTQEGNYVNTATDWTRSAIHGFTVPANAAKLTIKTLSATNGADVLSRRLMLNRGTLALPFIPSTDLIESNTILPQTVMASEGTQAHNIAQGLAVATGDDGDSVTFAVAWDSIPDVVPVGGGITSNSSLTGDQELVFEPLNLSTSGFTISLKSQELAGGTPTNQVDSTESAPSSTVDEQIDKGVANEADNDQYTIRVAVTVNTWSIGGEPPEPGWINIGFYSYKNGVGWTKRAEVQYTSSGTKSKTITVDGLNSTADKWGVKRESKSPGTQTLDDIIDVSYSYGGTQTVESASPTGASSMKFLIIGGGEGGI